MLTPRSRVPRSQNARGATPINAHRPQDRPSKTENPPKSAARPAAPPARAPPRPRPPTVCPPPAKNMRPATVLWPSSSRSQKMTPSCSRTRRCSSVRRCSAASTIRAPHGQRKAQQVYTNDEADSPMAGGKKSSCPRGKPCAAVLHGLRHRWACRTTRVEKRRHRRARPRVHRAAHAAGYDHRPPHVLPLAPAGATEERAARRRAPGRVQGEAEDARRGAGGSHQEARGPAQAEARREGEGRGRGAPSGPNGGCSQTRRRQRRPRSCPHRLPRGAGVGQRPRRKQSHDDDLSASTTARSCCVASRRTACARRECRARSSRSARAAAPRRTSTPRCRCRAGVEGQHAEPDSGCARRLPRQQQPRRGQQQQQPATTTRQQMAGAFEKLLRLKYQPTTRTTSLPCSTTSRCRARRRQHGRDRGRIQEMAPTEILEAVEATGSDLPNVEAMAVPAGQAAKA